MFSSAKRIVRVMVAFAVASLSGCASQTPHIAPTASTRSTSQLEQFADRAHATGFSGIAFVASRQQVLLDKAYGRLKPASPNLLRGDSIFRLASISKQITAILVMQDVVANRLSLDEPLGRFWPEFPSAAAREITVRQLLMHTSGLPNPDKVDDFYQPSRVSDSHMRRSAETTCAGPLQRNPGASFEYNNCDYLVLGALLERVAQSSFAVLVNERIFKPAGMSSAGVYQRDTPDIEMHAQGLINGRSDGQVNPAAYGAAGGLYGSVRDIWQLNRAFMDGRLLNDEARQIMTRPNQWGAALGVWSYELKATDGRRPEVVERQGWIGGIRVVNLLDVRTGLSVIVMSTNGDYDLSQSWSGKGLAAELLLCAVSSCP